MYSKEVRSSIYNDIINYISTIKEVNGIVSIGSATIGFKDNYSDLDFMISVDKDEDSLNVKDLIKSYIDELGYSFGKVIDLGDNVYIIVSILDNFLELDISIVPFDKLVTRSEQWKVVYDRDDLVYNKMMSNWNDKTDSILKIIDRNNLVFETTYLIRRCLFEVARNNNIYAANILSDIRENIILIECLYEGKKVHQLKDYTNLDPIFLNNIENTFTKDIDQNSIYYAVKASKDLLFKTLRKITADEKYYEYDTILDKYFEELSNIELVNQ